MFYVEVILESNGNIKDVKIHHEGKVEQQVSEIHSNALSISGSASSRTKWFLFSVSELRGTKNNTREQRFQGFYVAVRRINFDLQSECRKKG